jgi:divalent metal cation (Fe/Co/Zn/Cd) transporter
MPKELSVENAHKYCDTIEEKLTEKFENLSVTIHVEPS